MKRKTVFPHRTVKMREDFLAWARRQRTLKAEAEPGQETQADDGALTGAPDDNPAARQRRQANE